MTDARGGDPGLSRLCALSAQWSLIPFSALCSAGWAKGPGVAAGQQMRMSFAPLYAFVRMFVRCGSVMLS